MWNNLRQIILYNFICNIEYSALLPQNFYFYKSLQESQHISVPLRYPPIIMFVCDTPCGFVRHKNYWKPDIAKELWGDFAVCFEKPSLDKLLEQIHLYRLYKLFILKDVLQVLWMDCCCGIIRVPNTGNCFVQEGPVKPEQLHFVVMMFWYYNYGMKQQHIL